MDIERVIERFAFAERLPVRDIKACLTSREEAVPGFLRVLERCTRDPNPSLQDQDSLFLILHVLGEMEETRAFQPLMDFLVGDQDRVDRLLGDVVTETLHQILISTFDGDAGRMYGIMNDAGIDEFVRDSVFRAWTFLAAAGRIDRGEALEYLRGAFETLRPARDCHVWVSWVEAAGRLGFEELREVAKQAFEERRLPDRVMEYRHFENDLANARANGDREEWLRRERLHPFGDTIGELSKWPCYSEEYKRRERRRQAERRAAELGTARNPNRLVGRNDPCPCGSGQKFKKCCLH